MKVQQGFRIPEPSDRVIQFPGRGRDGEPVTAIYSRASLAWLIPGNGHAYGNPKDLITAFGNDWYAMYLGRAVEGAS